MQGRTKKKLKIVAATTVLVATSITLAVASSPDKATKVPAYLLNPSVTQASTHSTICRSGYTQTIRPSTSYTSSVKIQQLGPSAKLSDYEEDHWIPLELGGAPQDTRNLWPEPWPDARKKDVKENADHKAVCNGTMTLAEAQLDMYTNWGPKKT